MIGYGGADPRAWGFTRGAARVLGVNLTGAVLDGWLRRAELTALLQVCQGCVSAIPCADFLARTVTADALPRYCPNKAALESLRP